MRNETCRHSTGFEIDGKKKGLVTIEFLGFVMR